MLTLVLLGLIQWTVLSVCLKQSGLVFVDHVEPFPCIPACCRNDQIRNVDIGVRWVHSSKSFGDGEYFRLAVGDEYSIFIVSRELTIVGQHGPAIF